MARIAVVVVTMSMAALVSQGFASSLPKGPRADAVQQFDEVDLQGRRWNLTTMKDRLTLLEFWGTWCKGCGLDHKYIHGFYPRCREAGLEVLGIVVDDLSVDSFREWLRRNDLTWPQVYGGSEASRRLHDLFELEAFPSYLLIDGNGAVLATHGGPLLWENDKMLRELNHVCALPTAYPVGSTP